MEPIEVTKEDYFGREEIYDDFYTCPNCKEGSLIDSYNYCPMCGKPLVFVSTVEL